MPKSPVLSWSPPIRFRQKSVLVVDDSMLIRHTVSRWLEERGFQVTTASNGLEALRCLQERTPELIITDLQMPKMDGREFMAALQAGPATRKIPVIVLSTRPQSESQVVRDYPHIFKDIDVEEQLERVLGPFVSPVSH